MSDDLHLRKLQRQRRIEDFAAAAKNAPRLRLALARMGNAASLRAAAEDQQVPPDDRELAAWASGDLREGLMALRRRPGCAGIAESWLLLIKGEAARALARFDAAAAEQPRRAAVGATVALAELGRLPEAAKRWATVGPIPGAVFPAAGELTRLLTRNEAGWDGSSLRRLLTTGTQVEVETALRACPSDRVAERAWLSLRLADLIAVRFPADQRLEGLFKQAFRLEALQADVLKRRVHLALQQHEEGDDSRITALADLYQVLAKRDGLQARQAVTEITRTLSVHVLRRFTNPWINQRTGMPGAGMPPEWLLLWFRAMAPMVARLSGMVRLSYRYHRMLAGLPRLPKKMKDWRPILRSLDAEYASDLTYLDAKLELLEHFGQYGELRLAAYQLALAAPDQASEHLARWRASAGHDRRAKKAIGVEWAALWERHPGAVMLAEAHLELLSKGRAVVQHLASAMPPVRAAVFCWMHEVGEVPDLGTFGQDDEADLYLLATATTRSKTLFRRLVNDHAGRMHQVLLAGLGHRQSALVTAVAEVWRNDGPDDWRSWYCLGKALIRQGKAAAAFAAWMKAHPLIPLEQPEFDEIDHWLELYGGELSGYIEDEDEDEDDQPPQSPPKGPEPPPLPPSPQPPPRPAAPIGIRDLARSCGMEGSLMLAGLDPVVRAVEGGAKLSSLPAQDRDQLRRFLNSIYTQLPSGMRPVANMLLKGLI